MVAVVEKSADLKSRNSYLDEVNGRVEGWECIPVVPRDCVAWSNNKNENNKNDNYVYGCAFVKIINLHRQ